MQVLERAHDLLDKGVDCYARIDDATLGEAVFVLLERADRALPFVELLTMVGLADHMLLRETGSPISGDDYLSIPNGPVPIQLFSEMHRSFEKDELWQGRVSVERENLRLSGAGECKNLSKRQKTVLERAFVAVRGKSAAEVVETMHEVCPAWLSNLNGVFTLSDALESFGASAEDATARVAEIRSSYRPLHRAS
ncbi:Panacea domain-containing protein [soil metagenome]